MRIAIIVTTYNRPTWLNAVLHGLARQDTDGFEVVIADDGSTAETTTLITEWQLRAPFVLRHAWQPDIGFRAGEARNRAVALCTADYLVFLDGDCLPFPDFVRSHRSLAERGHFVRGNRVLLSDAATPVLVDRMSSTPLVRSWWRWVWPRCTGAINRIFPLLPLGWCALRKTQAKEWRGAKTCNLAVWHSDFLAINGFDHTFTGWGLEDTDVVLRLFRFGIVRKEGSFLVPVLHCYHPEVSREHLAENQLRLSAMLASGATRSTRGYDELALDDRGAGAS